ncbi:hypothetical protein KIN20_026159 [Parelaphostrongylus tenuis]|uniref:Uncharacterized protein n=1 Tax=Parelaphostrongylus tenuis TaxID=148309 RepID=A0AAD5MZA5_PARTN|nr:hypothetical protein KIN20_026159 [Parelaphostrongylus tenuis]
MDNGIATSRTAAETSDSIQLQITDSQMSHTLSEGTLLESSDLQHDRDIIFDAVEEEIGGHPAGRNFECGGIEVPWLAENEMDDDVSTGRERELFYPAVEEAGANGAVTVTITKTCHANSSTTSRVHAACNDGAVSGRDSAALPQMTLEEQRKSMPLDSITECDVRSAHGDSSEANFLAEIADESVNDQQHYAAPYNLWTHHVHQTDAVASSEITSDVNSSDLAKSSLPNFPHGQLNNGDPLGDERLEMRRNALDGYLLTQNDFQLPTFTFNPSESTTTTNPSYLLEEQPQEYSCGRMSNPCLTYNIVSNNQLSYNPFPMYANDGLPLNQQFSFPQNIDVNANVTSCHIGQHRRPEDCSTQLNISPPQPPSALGVDQVSFPDFVASAGSTITTNVDNKHVAIALKRRSLRDSTTINEKQNQAASGFQMPFPPTYSQVNFLPQGGSSSPLLMPSLMAVQDDYVSAPPTRQRSLSQCPPSTSQEICAASLSSTKALTVVRSLEDIAVIKAPYRLGNALVKHSYYSWKKSQPIDVFLRNSVKSFEMTTSLSSKVPLNPPRSQSRCLNDIVPRVHSNLSNAKYPNMVDVNFRRRPGTKTLSRPRHLCSQTRDVIGRVCAYFREFSKRYSALGNNIIGTPFENPERMASHATGFTLLTIRRCGERMEAVPSCTYRSGAVPTDEELSNLSSTFSDEPWCIGAKNRARLMPTTRRKPRKKSPPFVDSTSETEELGDEGIVVDNIDVNELEENENGVPKRRRSQRILNQRRAKLLNRLKTKNYEQKSFTNLRGGKEKKAKGEEGTNLDASSSGDSIIQLNDCAIVAQLPKRLITRKRRSLADSLKSSYSESTRNKQCNISKIPAKSNRPSKIADLLIFTRRRLCKSFVFGYLLIGGAPERIR